MKAGAALYVSLLALSVSIATAAPVSSPKIARDDDPVRVRHGSPRAGRTFGAVPVRPGVDRPTLESWVEAIRSGEGVRLARPDSLNAVAAFPPVKLSGGGSVGLFGTSPNGLTAVWIETVAGIDELFSRPVDASGPIVHLSNGLFSAPDYGVTEFDFSPDGSKVVFTGDFLQGFGENSLASVPIGGGSISILNRAMVDEPVYGFAISPNGLLVVYLGIDSVHGSGRIEASTNSIVGGIPTQISSAGLSAHGQADVTFAAFTPDSASVVHAADLLANGRIDLFAGPATALYNATLSSAKGRVKEIQIGQPRVAYISDDTTLGIDEVYSVLLNGTGKLKLNAASTGDANDLGRSPDGTRVSYRANHDIPSVREGYTALVGVAASATKIHANLAAPRHTDSVNFTPDSASVLYRADELQVGETELFVRPVDLSAPSTLLHDAASGESVGLFTGRGVPVVGRRAVYPLFSDKVYMFSVATDGTEPPLQLSASVGAGYDLFSGYVPFDQSARLMAYGIGPTATGNTDKIYSKPIGNDLPPEQFNVTAGPGRIGVGDYFINATETHGVYSQDHNTLGTLELYSVRLDSDGDGTDNATDTCRFVANPGGGPAAFPQTITALNKTTFTWPNGADVRFARGASPLNSSYTTTQTGSLSDVRTLNDATTPSPGTFTWTLIAPNCPTRDWGNAGRNQALP